MSELFVKALIVFFIIVGSGFLVYFAVSKHKTFLKPRNQKIKILDTSYIDSKRKILLFSCENKKYLVLSNSDSDILIDSYAFNPKEETIQNRKLKEKSSNDEKLIMIQSAANNKENSIHEEIQYNQEK